MYKGLGLGTYGLGLKGSGHGLGLKGCSLGHGLKTLVLTTLPIVCNSYFNSDSVCLLKMCGVLLYTNVDLQPTTSATHIAHVAAQHLLSKDPGL